jgi:hypothetical protein
LALAIAGPLVGASPAPAEAPKKPAREGLSFGTVQAPSLDEARAQALAWLKGAGKSDEATLASFESLWTPDERPLLDRVAETLALADAEAKGLLEEARDASRPAPLTAPALFRDAKQPLFYRANLALAYAKALSNRRIYEESLDALKAVKAEQVVDPSAYFFHKAVAEHALILKEDATRTISRLLDEVPDAPERYKMVATLMHLDMQTWQEKDLDWIARKMSNIERRLDLARGGPKTQKMQKEVIARLDELIKQLENQAKNSSQANGGACPNGGQPGSPGNNNQPNNPQRDSIGGANSGPGNVDPKKLEALAKQWGKLPPKKQTEAMQELTRDMPAKYRDVIESYFRKLAQSEASRP